MEVEFATNRSDADDVLRHLRAHDAAFDPPLSTRVDLEDYSHKLASHAVRLEAWAGDELVGLVAVYCNAADFDRAFVSNVSVLSAFGGRGHGRRLMEAAIRRARAIGFIHLSLEVAPRAEAAIGLYRSLGFLPTDMDDTRSILMTLDLRATGSQPTV